MRYPFQLRNIGIALISGLAFMSAPLAAQSIESIDPSQVIEQVIDADLVEQPGDLPVYAQAEAASGAVADAANDLAKDATSAVDSWSVKSTSGAAQVSDLASDLASDYGSVDEWSDPAAAAVSNAPIDAVGEVADPSKTYKQDDLIGAAEGVFGKGAEGVAKLIQDLLSKQGEPNAYIVGREAGGAFFVGARYGSGTLFHKVEGERPVYWTGPSIGFDMGANVGNTFVLVYNLHDSEDLYSRFPAGEGQAYVVGGMTASYMRKGDKVLIPIRVGAGLRLGINAGYMKFSKKQRWLPF